MTREAGQWHGTPGGYTNHGCRDRCCGQAHTLYQQDRKLAARAKPTPDHVHGTEVGYDWFGCKCDACKAEHSRRDKERRHRREGKP